MENVNPFVPVPLSRLHARITQGINELRAISALIDLHLRDVEPTLPNESDMDELEFDDELISTPLISPFLDSYEESDNGEYELNEYGNTGIFYPKRIIISLDEKDLAFPDENPIRTLGDYSKPSHEGYRNTIELPVRNNVVPLRSDTIRLVQNGCSFHGLWSKDPNQHFKDFLKLVDSFDLDSDNTKRTRLRLFQFSLRDQAGNWLERLPAGSITIWEDLTTRFLSQFLPPGRNAKLRNDILILVTRQTIDQSTGGKLRDLNAEESWALLEDLALYDNRSWNDPRDFAKPVKAIALPQDVPSTSDRRLIKLENQVQRLMEAHLAPTQPTQVKKITTSCEICSGPHDT
ncbi:MAK10-like protein [Tanacetum coccineum]|uniref:MAK10-like protein n=1 Tax=Tanacetum coccineum TaxID=301880 RepID=A0ABQ4YR65_9ASTR